MASGKIPLFLGLWAVVVVASACPEPKKIQAFPENYAGVGLELRMEGDTAVVIAAIPGGPAAEAGLKAGDRLLSIDGDGLKGATLADVVARLRGPSGTQMTLQIRPDGRQETVTVVVVRRSLTKETGGYKPSE
jgi:C-terminal processing protease CtpA/Prc